MSKVIVHIDLNMFFVRCEEIKDPSLKNKAVAVGHEGRAGIISTCSYEARKYGVHSGMPTFQAVKVCPHLIIKPVDFEFYHKKSQEFFDYIKTYTSIIEKASVDECFADFTSVVKGVKDVNGFFKNLQDGLYKKTELMCSIGVAPTKFLAKMGSDYKKPMGITIIRRRDVKKILYPLDLSKMFGVGKKSEPKLRRMGINTIGDLADFINNKEDEAKIYFGKYYYTLKDWLNGQGNDEVVVIPPDPKSIGNSHTLERDTDYFDEIKEVIVMLSKEVSRRAKAEDKVGTTVQLTVKDTNREEHFVSYNKSVKLKTPTNEAGIIIQEALKLYEKNFLNKTIRLVGATLSNLIDKRDMVVQMTLFDNEKHIEESETKLLINKLNKKLNKPLLKRASEVKKKNANR